MKNKSTSTKVITGVLRTCFVNVFNPTAYQSEEPKYNLILLIPKSDSTTLAQVNAAIEAAKAKGKERFGAKFNTSNLYLPLQDGDEKRPDDPAFKDCFYIRTKSKNKPGVVDKDLNPILDQAEVYSGCYIRASINFFPYANGQSGIGCGLGNVQKIRDGEPLGGPTTAEVDFADSAEDFLS